MSRLFLAAFLVLASCSHSAPSNPEEACAEQADEDPGVRDILGIEAGNLDYKWQHEGELQQARKDAVTRCLQSRGAAPPGGGVERPR